MVDVVDVRSSSSGESVMNLYGAPAASTCAGYDHVDHMTTLPLATDQGTQSTPAPGYIPARVSSPERALIGSAFSRWAIMSHLCFGLCNLVMLVIMPQDTTVISVTVRVGTLTVCFSVL